MKMNWIQIVRLVMMICAVAGVIYALEFMGGGIAVWFWVTLLGVGFVGLLYSFRVVQRKSGVANREQEKRDKKRIHRRAK